MLALEPTLEQKLAETWRVIPGTRYEASDLGRIRSPTKVLKLRSGGKNSPYLTFHLPGRGAWNMRVHAAVLAAFVGPRPDGMVCCHNNGDKLDNRLGNLRYDTPRNNVADRALHGTDNAGERHGMSKLSNDDVRLILNAALDLQRALAIRFEVSEACIRAILAGRRRKSQ